MLNAFMHVENEGVKGHGVLKKIQIMSFLVFCDNIFVD
jgi:hypothetical protein